MTDNDMHQGPKQVAESWDSGAEEWLDTVSRFGIKEQTWLKDPRERLGQ